MGTGCHWETEEEEKREQEGRQGQRETERGHGGDEELFAGTHRHAPVIMEPITSSCTGLLNGLGPPLGHKFLGGEDSFCSPVPGKQFNAE